MLEKPVLRPELNWHSEIKGEVKVQLPRAPEVMTSPAFSELKRQCMAMVREESL